MIILLSGNAGKTTMPADRVVAILEDDLASADALSLIVSDWGAEALHARTADQILDELGARASALSWVIADFNIEGFPNGVEAAGVLQKACPHVRVLILTGTFHKRGEEIARAAGYEVMFKPALADDIVAWLARR